MSRRKSVAPDSPGRTTKYLGVVPDGVGLGTGCQTAAPVRRLPERQPALADTARTRLSLKPGQRGTKKLLAEYGDRLVCVRYRYDEHHARRIKTVELVVEEAPWWPETRAPAGKEIVDVRVQWQETELRDALKAAGGRWNPKKRAWEVRYDRIVDLDLEDRIV